MPKMGASKQSLEGGKPLPAGIVEFRVDDFKPKTSKKGDSVNLNPTMKVINNPNVDLNDQRIFFNCNTSAGWIMLAFAHSLGLQLEEAGDSANLPGDFVPDQQDPENVEKMKYQGPILGRTGRLEIGVRKDDKNKDQSYVKQFFCKVANCQEKHPDDLK